MKIYLILLIFLSSSLSFANESIEQLRKERIKTYFMDQALQVINEIGSQLEENLGELNHGDLNKVLTNANISISNQELIDNTGSLVDAIGVPGSVTLSFERWSNFIKEGRDVRLLVLHEVLRMAQIDDDNYVVSFLYLPILSPPAAQLRPYCNLRFSLTTKKEETKRVKAVGFGAPAESNGSIFFATGAAAENLRANGFNVSNNPMKEANDNALKDLQEKCEAKGYSDGIRNVSGYSSYENRNTNGFSRSEVKVSLKGTCYRFKAVRRKRKDQQNEICKKVSLCREFHRHANTVSLSSDDEEELDKLESDWRCQ